MNLPLGAEYDKNAPWNEKDIKPDGICEVCGKEHYNEDDYVEIDDKIYCITCENINQ